jgi:hypothetical protein
MATEMFAETVGTFQHSLRHIPESRGCILNLCCDKLRTRRLQVTEENKKFTAYATDVLLLPSTQESAAGSCDVSA